MRQASKALFESVRDSSSEFHALFPHRFDFIWASHSSPNQTVEWQTERRYPLGDRQINQGSSLYGVRFGSKTNYSLLDIDSGSRYHPKNDPFAIARIIGALEPLGLVSYLACTSSYSGGLHLYLPFEEPQSSWQLSIALSTLLENAGFMLRPGQLEVFPNPKPYRSDGTFSLFNAHRLPMQIGSYLLNDDFQPICSDRHTFVQHWRLVAWRNTIDAPTIKRVLKQFKRQPFRISGKADIYLNDLNAEIEMGWTGSGQTNRLLGRIAMRTYVFHHVIAGTKPLSGQLLIDEIVRVAKSLPGYSDWCRHQHEIEHRSQEWARCVESSHYFHYGDANGKYRAQIKESQDAIADLPNWNQQQSESAREKIRSAIADLLESDSLPIAATERFKKLLQYRIGGGSLYRHKDLWHPQYLNLKAAEEESSFIPQVVETKNEPKCTASLLQGNGSNDSPDSLSNDSEVTTDARSNSSVSVMIPPRSIKFEVWQALMQAAIEMAQQHQCQDVSSTQLERMQQYLASGDPILMAEAAAWLQAYQSYRASGREIESIDSSIDFSS
jgi:hypothetical protein